MDKATRLGKHMITIYRTEMRNKYQDIKEEAREKYEEAKFKYRVKKSKSLIMEKGMSSMSS